MDVKAWCGGEKVGISGVQFASVLSVQKGGQWRSMSVHEMHLCACSCWGG